MSRITLIIIVFLVMLLVFPMWPYSVGWGYYPFGGLSGVLVLLIILAILGII